MIFSDACQRQLASSYLEFPRVVEALRGDPLEAPYIGVHVHVHRDNIRSL